ncbi:hypothetical protein IWQ62_001614 [Dispira parvispora]|uniref:Uncharacterized protein n=1 Tax=Dispira parvispora TaxID=1520584 RepID=A0A9W8AUL8_9FUNG|nr:hypothetical protein IWQ62_001614 [Dispira parvispora]
MDHFPFFQIPETRILCVQGEIIQVSLNYLNAESEDLCGVYQTSPELQRQVQLSVLAALRSNFSRGVIQGNGFALRQVRKPWTLSEKYHFYKDRAQLLVSSYKYSFYLDFTDEARLAEMSGSLITVSEIITHSRDSPYVFDNKCKGPAVDAPEIASEPFQGVPPSRRPQLQFPISSDSRTRETPLWDTTQMGIQSSIAAQEASLSSRRTSRAASPVPFDLQSRASDTHSQTSNFTIARYLDKVRLTSPTTPNFMPHPNSFSASGNGLRSRRSTLSRTSPAPDIMTRHSITEQTIPTKRKASTAEENDQPSWLKMTLQKQRDFFLRFQSKKSVKDKVALYNTLSETDSKSPPTLASESSGKNVKRLTTAGLRPSSASDRNSPIEDDSSESRSYSKPTTTATTTSSSAENQRKPSADQENLDPAVSAKNAPRKTSPPAKETPYTSNGSNRPSLHRRASISSQRSFQSTHSRTSISLNPLDMIHRILNSNEGNQRGI